jgi:anti-sigma-K factor RskA
MKNAIMREVRASVQPATAKPEPAALPVAPRVPWLAYLAAAACLAVAFLSTSQLTAVRSQHERDVAQVAQLRAQLERQQRTEAILADALAPGAARFPVGLGLVARSNGRIILAMRHMPPPPKGKVYQAWTLRRGAKSVAPSITFAPDASGTLVVELPGSAADLAAVAVSVEPEGGSSVPTSKPMFVRPLS